MPGRDGTKYLMRALLNEMHAECLQADISLMKVSLMKVND
jgi:hypothetical protein